jgi:thiamine-phosphate pyrophosphorylase
MLGPERSLDVYVVTSSGLVPGRTHVDVGMAAIEGGAAAVQLRAPELEHADLLDVARLLAERCRAAGVLFIVNDAVGVAIASGADGAHVGQGDRPEMARGRLGHHAVLGVSVDTPEQAARAERAGADYLGVTVRATPTKPEAKPVGLGGLAAIAEATRLPVVGIGGIQVGNAREVLQAGAAGVAVVSAVGGAPDAAGATRALVETVRTFRSLGRP